MQMLTITRDTTNKSTTIRKVVFGKFHT